MSCLCVVVSFRSEASAQSEMSRVHPARVVSSLFCLSLPRLPWSPVFETSLPSLTISYLTTPLTQTTLTNLCRGKRSSNQADALQPSPPPSFSGENASSTSFLPFPLFPLHRHTILPPFAF